MGKTARLGLETHHHRQRSGGQYYWFVHDGIGCPLALFNTLGEVVWRARFGVFGTLEGEESLSGVKSPWRFPGQCADEETGLYYNLNRYYDPSTGRYISEDPIKSGTNFYAYVDNNSTSLIDPFGLFSYDPDWALKLVDAADKFFDNNEYETAGNDGSFGDLLEDTLFQMGDMILRREGSLLIWI